MEGSFKSTWSSTTEWSHEFFLSGEFSFNDSFSLKSGFSSNFHFLPSAYFFSATLSGYPPFLAYSIRLMGREYPLYEIRENSICPVISLRTAYVHFDLGAALRNINSIGESWTYNTLYNLAIIAFNREKWSLRLDIGNFDDFRAGNISDTHFTLSGRYSPAGRYSFFAQAGFTNSGIFSFASYYSSFYGGLGVRFTP